MERDEKNKKRRRKRNKDEGGVEESLKQRKVTYDYWESIISI